jgi:hypothetical protein
MVKYDTVPLMVAGATVKIINELQDRFPSSYIMNAQCIIYLQFWLGEVVDRELYMHLSVIK